MPASAKIAYLALICLMLALSGAVACSRSGPERAVQGYMVAVNAGDCRKALEYISPHRRLGFWSYDLGQPRSCRSRKVAKYHNIQGTLVRDSERFPGCREVTVKADKVKWDGAFRAQEALFVTERIEGGWYIRSASW